MLKLVMMKGLPGSGKTTYARKLVDDGYVRVNKDDLRSMLNNGKYSKGNEKLVLKVRDYVVREALSAGRSVVVDDTNFEAKHAEKLRELAIGHNAMFQVEFIDTPIEKCIENDLKRTSSVGEKVIRRMYNKYVRVIDDYDYQNKRKLPAATICDIDGTLAKMKDRSPYDWSRVGEDDLNHPVAGVLQSLSIAFDVAVENNIYEEDRYKIILMSGRDESCRKETEEWLDNNHIPYDFLYMRSSGDNRDDRVVKAELYDTYVKGKYFVNVVFDDRDKVVEMWRNKGLTVFQVAEGDF